MIQSIISSLGPTILYLLNAWVSTQKKNKEMTDSYYNFLKQVDKSGAVKVANYLAAEDALKAKQEEMRLEIEQNKLNKR